MTQTVWKTYNGIDVTVDDSGEFRAEVNGVFLADLQWERLRLRIEQEKKADAKATKLELDCLALIATPDNGDYIVHRLTMIGLNRKDSSFKWGEQMVTASIACVLPNTPKNGDLLQQLAIAKCTVRDIEQAIEKRVIHSTRWGGRIDPTKYNDELRNLSERYQTALKESK